MTKRILALTGLALVIGLPIFAQAKPGETVYGKYEINIFGGGSFFKRQDARPYLDFGRGGVAGFRITENFWNYVGFEQAVTVQGTNNATFTKPFSLDTVSFGTRQRQFMLGPVFHFTPRDWDVRPFVTAGPGFNWYIPTDEARNQALTPNGNGLGAPTYLKTGFAPMFYYGGGVKAKLSPRVGLRVDARGFMTQSVTLGVPEGPQTAGRVTITERSPLNSLQLTGGLTFYTGKLIEEPLGDFRAGALESSATSVCPGDTLTFKIPVTNTMNGMAAKYKWTVDGQDQANATDTLTIKAPDGPKTLGVRAIVDADSSGIKEKSILRYLKKNPIAATARDTTVQVKEYRAPGVSASASPTQIGPNDTSTLTATPRLSECSGDVTYNWSVDRGTLSGTGATRTFSPTGMNLACGTTGTANATVTITDSKGGTASANVPVTVAAAPCPAPPPPAPELRATQFDDILFANGNGRVNNCGKRTLDRVYEQAMASNDYDILIVGHIDTSESKLKRPRNAKALDRERAENAAAYLISGDQPCKRFDRSRVKIAVVGDNQNSPLRTSLCEASVKERSSGRINPNDDKAKFRRVEVWLVPRDGKGPMPAGISGIEPAPEVKGCPK